MEPTPERPIVSAEELRVELRRFLAGIPYSHRRELSPTDRQGLRAIIHRYVVYSVVFFVFSVLITLCLYSEVGHGAWFFACLFLSVPVCCLYWMWPYVQALRQGQVDVYIGRMHQLAKFDVALDHYMRTGGVQSFVNRYVELHAVGKGERIWKLEGVPNDETLSGVRAVSVALVPDHDERGERPLTKEEKAELDFRARDLMRIAPILATVLVTGILSLTIGGILAEVAYGYAWLAVAAIWLLSTALALRPLAQRWQFGLDVLRDRRAGKVTDGFLPSGLPWVVDGQPARWRVGRPRGGANGITRDQALALEDLAKRASQAPPGPLPTETGPRP